MQTTSKGQVTIPQEVRNQLGLLPHTEVEFEVAGDHARIRKARRTEGSGVRGQKALRALRGSADYAYVDRRDYGAHSWRQPCRCERQMTTAMHNLALVYATVAAFSAY